MMNTAKFFIIGNFLGLTCAFALLISAGILSSQDNASDDLLQMYNWDNTIGTVATNIIICSSLLLGVIVVTSIFAVCMNMELPEKMFLPYTYFQTTMIFACFIFGIISAVSMVQLDKLAVTLNDSLRNDYVPGEGVVADAWDQAQLKLSCCGAKGPEDYSVIPLNGTFVPSSCCKYLKQDENHQPINETLCQFEADQIQHSQKANATFLNTEGCYSKIKTNIYHYLSVLLGVSMSTNSAQVIYIIMLHVWKRKCAEQNYTSAPS
ncbi:CD82 antigen-like isoform X1 [Dreissena polymorpha]|uniref:CD82 antigen-like isoform X1 n=1 Tax=Dreissena polymorpha TaxID=45954 RepID=UPI0022649B49|nr:CD82 antigen-like isoform X1 [Dreissena polymorpha]